jgi:2-polyprenyl-6-methoxyphenol hydroxylase-like FAD-dependent oxidoreductase
MTVGARDRPVVAGGGIGGLAAAVAFGQRGCDVPVQQAGHFGEIAPASIELVCRVLFALGLEARRLAVHSCRSAPIRDWKNGNDFGVAQCAR